MKQEMAKGFAEERILSEKWDSVVRQFEMDALAKGYYSNASFELTAFCNLKCPMCYVRIDKSSDIAQNGKPCTAGQWIELARQFRDQGGLFLLLTGGEPLLRPDFPEIYGEISKMGLFIALFTNGILIDDKILSLLKKSPPAMIGLTLYGASENTYKKFGGNDGSFHRAVEGLDRLLTIPNLVLDVRSTLCSENYMELRDVFELVLKRNRLLSIDYNLCAPVRGAVSDARKLRLSKEQKQFVHATVREMAAPYFKEYEKLILHEAADEYIPGESGGRGERGMRCNGGKTGVYISWNGTMYPCNLAAFPYSFPLIQGFKNAADDIRHQTDAMLLPEICLRCANRERTCTCIPRALCEMADCLKTGEKCVL